MCEQVKGKTDKLAAALFLPVVVTFSFLWRGRCVVVLVYNCRNVSYCSILTRRALQCREVGS